MVGPLTVYKMLHCKSLSVKASKKPKRIRKEQKQTVRRNFSSTLVDEDGSSNVKLEAAGELCRVCLQRGTIAIHGDDSNDDLADAVSTFADIQIDPYDPYPKYLCNTCHELLQGAILFRKTAQRSDKRLKKKAISELDMDDHFSYEVEMEPATSTGQKFSRTCKPCEMHFDSFEEYQEHRLSSEHENKKKTCPVCNKTFRINYFKVHMNLHGESTAYICDVCGKRFALHSQFNRHRLTHFYSLPFQCDLCPYKGRFSESLKMHMRSHTGEKPYICEECPQRFVSKSNLNKHMLSHTKEHKFRCECGRGFYTKRELEMHFKVEHVGVKDHVCEMCGKAFGYRKQLMKHERQVHKREKLRTGRMPLYLKVESMKMQENNPSQAC